MLKQWTNRVAYLPQQVFLVDETLRRNVALGCNDIDEDRVINALKKAKLLNFVDQLSEGIDTKVGERGVRLSGGQRQRVALARAFYHNRDILVMDESTSALDSDTEYEIIQEIQKYKGDRTIIVIAHRLTTLKYCDRIYKLQDGKVINIGSYMDFK
jgi:ABC-type multidrug transport system fused ATPase/permease subunit